MSLWRKRGTSDTNRDTIAPDVGHNEQKHDILSNPLDLLHEENVRLGLYKGVYDLSIKSDDLSIKSEKAMREVQRLGQEIEQEPVAWMDEEGDVLSASIVDGKGLRNIPLYTNPPQRIWAGLTEEERGICINANMGTGLWAMAKDIEAKLKEKNT
jgi:hypothetical protein